MTATDSQSAPWLAWRQAADRPGVDAALRQIYDQLASEIDARSPTCWISGRCCHFDQFGHRLYVTGLEIAWMLGQLEPSTRPEPDQIDLRGACIFQVSQMCSVHALRPLGCRIFYCQQGTEHWQQDLYERFLNDLRSLHRCEDLPYRYMEWRAGLREAVSIL